MNYMGLAVAGSVRQAPQKASPIKQVITAADLAGLWVYGVGSIRSYYNGAGQFTVTRLPPEPPNTPSRLTELTPIPTAGCKATCRQR